MKDYEREVIQEVTKKALKAGYRVFIAESGTYGFYTNEEGARVVSFQIDLFSPVFSGNYKTSNPRKTGTGWQIGSKALVKLVKPCFDEMFNSGAPRWAVKDATWRHTTLEEHQKLYQSSSRYQEVKS